MRAAREWPSTPGKVVVSSSELRDVKVLDSEREGGRKLEQRNFANIVYEYSVSGQKLRNNRVSIGEDRGNFQVAETIAKYPVGTVVTVYYNSRHPREAVLERDLPQGLWGCLGIATAIAVVGVFGASIGLTRISEFVSARLVNPQMSVPVVALAGFGLVAALFALVLRRQSALAKTWPVVPGTIKLSGLDEYRAAPSDSGRRGSIMYERKVSYSYRFKDVDLYRRARQLLQQLQDDVAMAAAAVRDGFSGRRQRQGLGQSGQSVGGDAQSPRAVRLAAVADRPGAVDRRVSDGDVG